ncbi:hypothetical protein Hanom_Chr15g01367371 [Helianthus anomalus]
MDQTSQFYIPCDPFNLVFMNTSLDFDLRLIWPLNFLDLGKLGLNKGTPLLMWKTSTRTHTQGVCFGVESFI